MIDAGLRTALLIWAERFGRDLPTPARSDPWAVMVLEVASQQTQIVRSIEAADRFVARFPTPAALAAATPADAIREWAGLGYYRRAVMLRAAAVKIVAEHGGVVPASVAELAPLPGIGPYTSRAIVVHAFGIPVAPLDTNLRRVTRRFFGGDTQADRRAEIDRQRAADGFVAGPDPSPIVRALMDLATLVCRPAKPDCDACPLSAGCASAFAPVPPRPPRKGPAARPFAGSRRWLRGRIIEQLSQTADGEWFALDALAAAIPYARGTRAADGDENNNAVADAISRLAADGLVEVAGKRARLAVDRR